MEAIVRVPPSICPTLPKVLGIRARNKRLKVLVLAGTNTYAFGHYFRKSFTETKCYGDYDEVFSCFSQKLPSFSQKMPCFSLKYSCFR